MSDDERKDLPYGCEYAKSNRSKCKRKECGETIDKGELRMSARIPSKFSDGLMDIWFHFDCFWDRARRGLTEASIRGFENLKWEDQERIRVKARERAEMPEDAGAAKSKSARVEYAKSGRGKCSHCKEKIEEKTIRIQFRAANYHPECLAKTGTFDKTADEILEIGNLEPDDQQMLRTLFEKHDEELKRKRAASAEIEEEKVKRMKADDTEELQEALKKQSDLLWQVRNKIQEGFANSKTLKSAPAKKKFLVELVEQNGIQPYRKATADDLEQALADLIVFGALEPCPECGNGLYYSASRHSYVCPGRDEENDDARCTYTNRMPKRRLFTASEDAIGDAPFLKEYSGKQPLMKARIYSVAVNYDKGESLVKTTREIKQVDPARKRKKEPVATMKDNGFAVDAYFKLVDDYHVYVDEDGVPYQFYAQKDDKIHDQEVRKFYKAQLLEEDGGTGSYFLHRRYGTVGTDTTVDSSTEYDDLDAAMKEFVKLFRDKTGNDWEDRHNFQSKGNAKRYVLNLEWEKPILGTYGRSTKDSLADIAAEEEKAKKAEEKAQKAAARAAAKKTKGKGKKKPKDEDSYEDDFIDDEEED